MEALERKTVRKKLIEIARVLSDEFPEIRGTFGARMSELLEESGFDPMNRGVRGEVIYEYHHLRRGH